MPARLIRVATDQCRFGILHLTQEDRVGFITALQPDPHDVVESGDVLGDVDTLSHPISEQQEST